MGLDSGESVFYRLASKTERYHATIAVSGESSVELEIPADKPPGMAAGQYIVVSDTDGDYYTEITGISEKRLQLKRMWFERREYFRVDDVFPVNVQKVDKSGIIGRSRIVAGYAPEPAEYEIAEDLINPGLWKMLANINTKLELIMQRLDLEQEGLIKAENRCVNVSASGIRFTVKERFEAGDNVEVKLLLPKYPPMGIVTSGQVVRVKDTGEGTHEVAISFRDMDEEVREEIIQYALKRQRDIIRLQKQQSGTDDS